MVIFFDIDGTLIDNATQIIPESTLRAVKALGEEFARVSGYDLADTPYSSSFAGYKDWFIQEFRRPGFTVEAGLGENPLPLSQFPTIYRDNLGIFTTAAMGLSTKER